MLYFYAKDLILFDVNNVCVKANEAGSEKHKHIRHPHMILVNVVKYSPC